MTSDAEHAHVIVKPGIPRPADVCAVAVFDALTTLGDQTDLYVLRTADASTISTCVDNPAISVIGTGGRNDTASNCFDFPHNSSLGTRPNGVPYSCFGLVWLAYGHELVRRCGMIHIPGLVEDEFVNHVWNRIDSLIVQSIDAESSGLQPLVYGPNYRFSDILRSMVPHPFTCPVTNDVHDEAFIDAVHFSAVVVLSACTQAWSETAQSLRDQGIR